MAVYIGHDECRVIYVAKNGQQLRVSSIWVGDQQVFPPANRQQIHVFNRDTQGYGRTDNGTHFGYTVPVPWWATSLDVVLLGAGEKGRDGTKSFTGGTDGAGGRSGAWAVRTVALTPAADAMVRVGKGTSTSPHATEVILPGVGGQADVRVHDGEGTRTPGSGSTGGTPSPQDLYEYDNYHYGAAGGTRNNLGSHPGGGGGGGQGSTLIGNPREGQSGGDGYVWIRFRSAPALNPGEGEFILRVGVTSGAAYYPLRAWVASIGKTFETITEITVPMEVIGPSLQYLFADCASLVSVPYMDTSQVTNMYAMFYGCSSLVSVPELDTSQVTDMRGMFNGCQALTTIPELDTSQVPNMYAMFYDCSSLVSVPELDTSQVTDMSGLFEKCSSLTTIPELNTSQVTNMYSMFQNCSSLTSIPALDTSQVVNMRGMFYRCSSLTTIPELDTSNVTTMYAMFYVCSSLTTVPALNARNVEDIYGMFLGCSSLESVTLPGLGNGFTTRSTAASRTLDMRETKLNATAANALMQSLGTPPTRSPLQLPATATGANTSIAASKNWTVTIG